jgi:hypothetical protein
MISHVARRPWIPDLHAELEENIFEVWLLNPVGKKRENIVNSD